MSFNIEFDYRFAPANVITENVKFRLEQAAQIWESLIADEFPDLPAGTSVDVSLTNTETIEDVTINHAVDDLLIFITAAPNIGAAGYGGPAIPNIPNFSQERHTGDDFEPAVGSIIFESNDDTVAYLGTALHEIGHVLGISASPQVLNDRKKCKKMTSKHIE